MAAAALHRRSALPGVSLCVALALVVLQSMQTMSAFLPPSSLGATAGAAAPSSSDSLRVESGRRLHSGRSAKKTLFEETKSMNAKLSEANSENEMVIDTDNLWGIFFAVISIGATIIFIAGLEQLKPKA
mmetsp:Transcript_41938/g.91467  ORF Transcript_41938/g.91467 Transcript_41938/m.91467 type:complete len:129 (+) Transcript_41938:56-442(+)